MAHSTGYQVAGTNRSFLGRTDHTILRLADHGGCYLIRMAPLDKVHYTQHLVLLVAQHTPDHRSGKFNGRRFQRLHCDQHGGQIAFGIIAPTAVHPATDNFRSEWIIFPSRYIPRRNNIGMALKHKGALLRTGRPADNDVWALGRNLVDLNFKTLCLGPIRHPLRDCLFIGAGSRVPY